MSDDLVKRLRAREERKEFDDWGILHEAADRIEALQAEQSNIRAGAHAAAIEASADEVLHDQKRDPADYRIWLDGRPYICEESAYHSIRDLHTDASREYLAARDERIKREAREEALRDMLGLTINHAPERDDIHAAITALIEKEGV